MKSLWQSGSAVDSPKRHREFPRGLLVTPQYSSGTTRRNKKCEHHYLIQETRLLLIRFFPLFRFAMTIWISVTEIEITRVLSKDLSIFHASVNSTRLSLLLAKHLRTSRWCLSWVPWHCQFQCFLSPFVLVSASSIIVLWLASQSHSSRSLLSSPWDTLEKKLLLQKLRD